MIYRASDLQVSRLPVSSRSTLTFRYAIAGHLQVGTRNSRCQRTIVTGQRPLEAGRRLSETVVVAMALPCGEQTRADYGHRRQGGGAGPGVQPGGRAQQGQKGCKAQQPFPYRGLSRGRWRRWLCRPNGRGSASRGVVIHGSSTARGSGADPAHRTNPMKPEPAKARVDESQYSSNAGQCGL